MADVLELHLPQDVIIGGGVSARVDEAARGAGIARPLVVTDAHMLAHGPAGELVARLGAAGMDTAVYAEVQPDPTVENVEGALAALRAHGADGVVAVGGGSPLDTGKAVAIMATHDGAIADYAGWGKFARAGLPLIAMPTTAGTGSEVTRAAVITDTARAVKMLLFDGRLLPRVALVDYHLTLTMPRALTAHVGIDSLTHAIEAYVSSRATMLTDLFALQAVRLISRNLRTAFAEPGNEAAREAMMLGATLAGVAFSNASVALVHGMSRPIGAHFHLPHGLSNAILLPAVTRFSLESARARYAVVAREMGVAAPDSSDEAAAARLLDELEAINRDLEIPRLRELGVGGEHFESVLAPMAEAALASGSPDFNPRRASAEEIMALYHEVY